MSGPLTRVLAAFADGAGTLRDVAAVTGLAPDVVAASVDHLVRLGRLRAEEVSAGCPTGGCGTCPVAAAGCASASGRRGALTALTLAR